ncbi:hypothetical protein [Rhizobium sp. NZLR11]|uniref:hypothetical protein n=1 Tax=Rhizobium sp. NZLR11 TaxID=2731098 RepID=UPI001C833C16|nr:hypothetical protein [Rhizobium sp. NZLR11]MBX5206841.1 hypothetical protein [Rhizobium sp. NZLR11]
MSDENVRVTSKTSFFKRIPWWGYTGAAIVVVGLAFLILPAVILNMALKELNKAGIERTVEDIRRGAIAAGVTSLSTMPQPDTLLRLQADDLQRLVDASISVADKTIPVKLTGLTVGPDNQVIGIAAKVDGRLDDGTELTGTVNGAATLSFVDGDLLLQPAFDRITLNTIKVPGWNWLPGQIVGIANPAIAQMLARINGALPPQTVKFLPPATEAKTVRVGDVDIVIPAIVPTTPAVLIATDGIVAVSQLLPSEKADAPSGDTGDLAFEAYRRMFLKRIEPQFPAPVTKTTGLHFADRLLDGILGGYRAPADVEPVVNAAAAANSQVLNDVRGPDVVVFLSGDQFVKTAGDALASALKKQPAGEVTWKDVKPKLIDGAIQVEAIADARIPIGDGRTLVSSWRVVVVAVPNAVPGKKEIRIVPRIGAVQLLTIDIGDNTLDVAQLVPLVNQVADTLKNTVNSVLPAIPVNLPVLAPQEVELKPSDADGLQVRFTPERFSPSAITVDRVVASIGPRGFWLLGDVSNTATGDTRPNRVSMPIPEQTTPQDIEKAAVKLVGDRYGPSPTEPIFGFVSWGRFAEIFNADWARLHPQAGLTFDTGTQPMETQRINLMDYARFECHRKHCEQARCEQRSCSFSGCSRNGCNPSCPSVNLWVGSVEEPGCVIRRQACNTAADIAYGSCQAGANAEKAGCDASAVADKAACDIKSNADLLACNAGAETEMALCGAKKLLTNGLAEISGVGAIGGDSRIRATAQIDAAGLQLDTAKPGGVLNSTITGSVTGNIGLDWTPYDIAGHLLVCPVRGKIFVEDTAHFQNPARPVTLSILGEGQVPADEDPLTVDLAVKIAGFRIPVTLDHGLLNALYAQNPQIAVTCPVASSLLVPGLVMGGSFRAISENDLAKALAGPTPSLAVSLFVNANDDVKAGMGVLFGGSFSIPVEEQIIPVKIKQESLDIFGTEYRFKPSIANDNFRLVSTGASTK